MEDGRMKAIVKTWLVAAAAIGMAGMAFGEEGWADKPLKWDTKGKEEAAAVPARTVKKSPKADGTRGLAYGGETHWVIAPRPGEERVEKEAEEQEQPDIEEQSDVTEQPVAAEPKTPAKKSRWKEGGETAVKVLGFCVAGTLGILLNCPELLRLLIH
jgi:hypothetical protein